LNELLVSAGLARIYGARTPLPDGRDSRDIFGAPSPARNAGESGAAWRVEQGAAVNYWKIKEAMLDQIFGEDFFRCEMPGEDLPHHATNESGPKIS
jgi:hypothetical protein